MMSCRAVHRSRQPARQANQTGYKLIISRWPNVNKEIKFTTSSNSFVLGIIYQPMVEHEHQVHVYKYSDVSVRRMYTSVSVPACTTAEVQSLNWDSRPQPPGPKIQVCRLRLERRILEVPLGTRGLSLLVLNLKYVASGLNGAYLRFQLGLEASASWSRT